jgi:hypothetical protein
MSAHHDFLLGMLTHHCTARVQPEAKQLTCDIPRLAQSMCVLDTQFSPHVDACMLKVGSASRHELMHAGVIGSRLP